ncbi:MAG: hypothetical protein ACHQ4H_12975 [Ktedonobacterales bacterium]
MLVSYAPGALAAMLLLLAPGLLWAWWCYPSPQPAARIAIGLAVGFAFQVHVCALLAWGPGITESSVLVATGGGFVLAGILIWRTRIRGSMRGAVRLVPSLQLIGLIALVAVPRLAPLFVQTIPSGWDPSFHSLLASTTLTSHQLPTWSPFEQIPSNYPYGPHVFIAEISLITGIAPDRVFAAILGAALPAFTCVALYALATRVLRSHLGGLAAVATYGLIGNWGSIEYYQWGGLPNELGCFMLLAFLVVLFGPRFELTRVLVGGVILGAIPLTHHQVMLTTVIVLSAYFVYLALRWFLTRDRPAVHRQIEHVMRRLLLMGGLAIVMASYYVLPLALRVASLGNTLAARYADTNPGNIVDRNGRLLWELAIVGAVLVGIATLASRGVNPRLRSRFASRGTPGLARAAVAVAAVALFVAFVFGYYVYRYYSFHFTSAHFPSTLFTPSRFLTDMTYFLAIFAAIPLTVVWRWTVLRLPPAILSLTTARTLLSVVVRGVIVVVFVSLTINLLHLPDLSSQGQLQAGEPQAFAWIKANTATDTLVINLDQTANWAPYFTQREVAYTPVPVSEFTAGYVDEKQSLTSELMTTIAAAQPLDVLAFDGSGAALSALEGRPVVILTHRAMPQLSASLAYQSGPEMIYRLGAAFDRMRASAAAADPIASQWWGSATSAPPAGWRTEIVIPAATGWTTTDSVSLRDRHAAYLRLVLDGPAAAGTALLCNAEGDVAVTVDGAAVATPCTGKPVPLPGLTLAGPHVVALYATFTTHMDPWVNALLVAGA